MTYDKGYFYPGPAVKNVPLSMAPQESQDVIKEFGRPEYDGWLAKFPHAQPLDAKAQVEAFRIWDQQVGAAEDEVGCCAVDNRRAPCAADWSTRVYSIRDMNSNLQRTSPRQRSRADFGNPSCASAVAALRELNLTVKRGEFIALLGPSGCGKSTALNCIAGLLPLSGGTIWLDEQRIDTLPPEKRGFGMVFQNYALFPHMTVRRNVGVRPDACAACRRPKRKRASNVRWSSCSSTARSTSCRGSSPAASSSASRSHAPS